MYERPAFDPSVYETDELAEIYRPFHDPAFDYIEASARHREAPTPENFEALMAARAKEKAARQALDERLAAYVSVASRETAPADYNPQMDLI